jgi:hypothetical protein
MAGRSDGFVTHEWSFPDMAIMASTRAYAAAEDEDSHDGYELRHVISVGARWS